MVASPEASTPSSRKTPPCGWAMSPSVNDGAIHAGQTVPRKRWSTSPWLLVAVMVKSKVSAAVGEPLMAPVVASSVSQLGLPVIV